ncbi:hypothetical protein [Niabella aurantiaca]|uniref:hypothetical protein n=1 Tax=Niabella aurantiaca TaxID=379900 RepID=UPI00037DE0E2|nr:hypothetical protein [Niabella aurantiaca]
MLKRMPFVLLLVTAVLLFVAGLFTRNKDWIDIHLYDTMFVVTQRYVLGIAAFFLFLLWLMNIATHRILFSNKLTWFHILATLVILCFLLWYASVCRVAPPRRYTAETAEPGFQDVNAVLLCSIAALIVVQLVFITNLLIGLYRKATR